MIAADDLAYCEAAIRTGSLSFHAASKLLPAQVRNPALALYAFCRLADDAVDEHAEKTIAVLGLRDRLDLAYAGRPRNAPADRAFAAIIEDFAMPRALPEALLEGLAWDAMERRYHTLSDVRAYGARVAAAVGAMMCVLMRVREADALARACDLGVAMQLTNIARDVGEDARAGRIYLPLEWFDAAGLDVAAFLADPVASDPVRRMVKRLLSEAQRLYLRAVPGVARLPFTCRPGICAARHIYDAIGADVARAGYDSITRRARSSTGRKLACLALSVAQTGVSAIVPRSPVLHAAPLAEVSFLVDAAATSPRGVQGWGEGRSGALVSVLATLEARDKERRAGLNIREARPN